MTNVDDYTVHTIKKVCGIGSINRYTIDSLFVAENLDDGEPRPRIFPGLNEKETKEVADQLWTMRDIQFPTFSNLQYPRTSDYVSFSRSALDILCWFDLAVVEELKRGNENVETRAKLEQRLKLWFNPAGTAAIMLYVIRNYTQLHQHCRDFKIDEPERYTKIFRYKVWFILGKHLMATWKVKPAKGIFYQELKKAGKKLIKV